MQSKFNIIALLIISLLTSAVLGELIVRYIVGYPDYGIDHFVYGISSNVRRQPIYQPFSGYWSQEGSIKPYLRNNLGLTGINTDVNKKLIFVMGSSFIEAAQIDPPEMAVSQFQKLLNGSFPDYSVINLGRKEHDLYDSWFRYQYYKNIYTPSYVIAIIDQRNKFSRHKHPLSFSLPSDFGKEDTRLKTVAGTFISRSSSFISLSIRGFKKQMPSETESTTIKSMSPETAKRIVENNRNLFLNSVFECLRHFHKELNDRLIVISIVDDNELNARVLEFCIDNKIQCSGSSKIQIPENQIEGLGHFNSKGNRILGKFIYDTFTKYKQ